MATVMITMTRTATPTATAITVTSVCGAVGGSVGGSVDGGTEQPSGAKESITTGHAVSTWSCVEATVMGGVEATQEVRREDRSTEGSAVCESSARNTTV